MAPRPVVHLELHTGDLERACDIYADLCGWKPETIRSGGGRYLALAMGRGIGGGVVECDSVPRPVWLPYVAVEDIGESTERARELGADVVIDRREGAAGWRSVLSTPAGGDLALWQPKR